MISEGTDIQRLCVCTYLSRIRTELHYRQVLGRILRKMGDSDVTAWLYVIAEPLLRKYSQRIADDLPEDQAMLQTQKLNLRLEKAGSNQMSSTQKGESAADNGPPLSAENINEREMLSLEPPLLTPSFSEYYRQHLLSLI